MAHYMVYWPQDQVEKLKKAGDNGPIKVVMVGIHSRMPTIASIKVGDVVFPVTLMKKKLWVMARLPVTPSGTCLRLLYAGAGNQS